MQLLLCGCLLLAASAASVLIPREKLFYDSPNAISDLSLSPDGKFIGYISPDSKKVKNVFTWRLADHEKRQVTFEQNNVKGFQWTGVPDVIIFTRDNHGDENTMLFKRNISESMSTTVICNKPGVEAVIQANDRKNRFVLVAMNDVVSEYHNVYKFDLETNELSLIFENRRFVKDFIFVDNDLKIRLAAELNGTDLHYSKVSASADAEKLTSAMDNWEEYVRVDEDDTAVTGLLGFDKNNENIYWIWGDDSNLGNLILAPINDFSQRKTIYKPAQGQIGDILFNPDDHSILAYSEIYHKPELVFSDATIADDMHYLSQLRPTHSLRIFSTSLDLQTWLVTFSSSEHPHEIFVYRRGQKSAELLVNLNPALEDYAMNKQIGFDFVARDGLKIQAYLSLPPETSLKGALDVSVKDRYLAEQGMIPSVPQKMVLLVHGGPMTRDRYGFSAENAFLTSRGYAVLQVNYRGSHGCGKQLANAGPGEWSRKAHSDLIDGVEFAVAKGIANRSAVAIMGGSYGGYATLVGMTFTPDVFACGIDLYGMSNLITLTEDMPKTWHAWRQSVFKNAGGDPDTEEGRRELKARSPLFKADRVKKPLMIMQGSNDPRVLPKESEQFVDALKNHSIPVTYIVYPDEGHGFRRTPNKLAELGFREKFLHNCLGGDYQPFTAGQYNESAIVKTTSNYSDSLFNEFRLTR